MKWDQIRRLIRNRTTVTTDEWIIEPSDRTDLPPSVVEWRIGRPAKITLGIKTFIDEQLDFFAGRLTFVTPLIAEVTRQTTNEEGTIKLNLGDWAVVRGVAFCSDHPADVLIPDTVFILREGYRDMRGIDRTVPWNDRSPVAFWRGSSTGIKPGGDWRRLQRVLLSRISLAHPDLVDAGITKVVQADTDEEKGLRANGLLRPFFPDKDFVRYRYQIDVDGNSNAWPSMFIKMLTGSPVLKVASLRGYRQWYYDRLIPWRNFIPVDADMSNLVERVNWLKSHDDEANAIGMAALYLATSLTYENEMREGAKRILGAVKHQ